MGMNDKLSQQCTEYKPLHGQENPCGTKTLTSALKYVRKWISDVLKDVQSMEAIVKYMVNLMDFK